MVYNDGYFNLQGGIMYVRFLLGLVFLVSSVMPAPAIDVSDVLSERDFRAGLLRYNQRQYDASIQLFQKSLSELPMNFRSRYYLGASYLDAGYSRNAIEEWENLVKLGGANYQVKQKLNDLYFRLSIDRSYSYQNPYILSKIYDGIVNGMHKIARPGFIEYDERADSIFVSSVETKFVVELDGNGRVIQEFGRKFGDASEFEMPTGICLSGDQLYAADYKKDKVFIFRRDGKLLGKIGSHGSGQTNIAGPMGVYVSPDDYLFVADNGNDRIQKYDLQGNWIQSIGEEDLSRPTDIAGTSNFLYVADSMHSRIVVYDTFGNLIETIGDDTLREPRGLYLHDGKLYIVDAKAGLYIYDLESRAMEKFGVDEEKLRMPFDMTMDSRGLIYETDFNSQNIAIFIPLQLQYGNLGVQISQEWLSGYPDNLLHFRVWDKKGNPIYNLREENLQVFENGTEIPLLRLGATYAYRDKLSVKFIVDRGPAMKALEPELVEAMESFLDKMHGDDWMDIVTVGDTVESIGKTNANVLRSMDWLKKQPYSSGTPVDFDHALYDGVTSLLNVNRNKAIVIFTAGDLDEKSFTDYEPDTVTTYARQNAVPVYVVSLSDHTSGVIRQIASGTFARFYTIREMREILSLCDEIRAAPPLEYILSYEGLNLSGLKDFWVNVHLHVNYKGMIGVDDTGYYVPVRTMPGMFGQSDAIDETKIRDVQVRPVGGKTPGGGSTGGSGSKPQ
jgi:tetratricopeptide (TPR) repeat protein